MSQIKLTSKEEIFEAMEIAEAIPECLPWKWGRLETIIFKRDDKFYMMKVHIHSQEGLQDDSVTAYEVVSKEKTVTEWVKV